MKKIFLFEDLNRTNFYLSLFLIPFYKKIYFREASFGKKNFFFKKYLNIFFFQIGLKDTSGSNLNKAFLLQKFLTKKYISNNYHVTFFEKFSKFINLNDHKKMIYSIRSYIYNSTLLVIGSSSYICKKIYFSNNLVYYFPSSKKTFLVMSEIKDDRLKIFSFTVLINEGMLVINKIFFYNGSEQSELFKDNIETLSFEKFDKLASRFFKIFKLKHLVIGLSAFPGFKEIFLFSKFFFKNIQLIKKNKLINILIFIEIYFSIIKYNKFFYEKNYKYLFFYNDYLIPPAMIISANICKIKTISFQDRLLSYFYYHHCIFDLYLIAGKKFEHLFKNKHLINKFEVLGVTRSSLIKETRISFIEKIKNNSKYDGIIACLLIGFRSDWNANIYGEVGNSTTSILSFCEGIVNLSKEFKKKYFIIKFKDDLSEYTELISSINKITSLSENVVVFFNNKLFTATQLIAHCDLIIGKISTVNEEALVFKKNVIIYDLENFVSTFGFYRKNKFLIAKNFDDLLFKTKSLLNKNDQFYNDYIKLKFDYVNNYLTDNGTVGDQSKISKIISEYIGNNN